MLISNGRLSRRVGGPAGFSICELRYAMIIEKVASDLSDGLSLHGRVFILGREGGRRMLKTEPLEGNTIPKNLCKILWLESGGRPKNRYETRKICRLSPRSK
jgi:hypothetical protein